MPALPLRPLLVLMILTNVEFIKKEAECSCINGFMDENLLRIKAAQIGGNKSESPSWNRIDVGYNIWPQLTFTCNGTISELLLAAEVQDFRAEFPTFDIWRVVQGDDAKYMVKASSVAISLQPSQIPTNGVITFSLPSPVRFQKGDVIGIYQPPNDRGWVQLYAKPSPASIVYTSPTFTGSTLYSYTSALSLGTGNTLLIYPMTDKPNCLSGFLDKNTVVTTGQKVPSVYVNPEPRVFPAISFSCNGWISAWIFASKLNASLPSGSHLVNLQLWRGEKAFTKATEVTIQQTDISCSEGNLHKVYLQTPMEFHAGDFLGIDQQISASNAELLIYDQQFNGPPNFSGSHEFSTIDILTPLPNNDFPLITIETTTIGRTSSIHNVGSTTSSHPVTSSALSSSFLYAQSQNAALNSIPIQTPSTESRSPSSLTSFIHLSTSVPPRSKPSPVHVSSFRQTCTVTNIAIPTGHLSASASGSMHDTPRKLKFFESVFHFALIVGLGGLVLLLNIFLCILVGALCCRRRSSRIKRSNTLPQSLRLPVGYVLQAGTGHQQESHYQRNQINLEMSSSTNELADSTEVRYVPTTTNSVYLEETDSYYEAEHSNSTLPTSSRAEYSVPQAIPKEQETMSFTEYNQAYNLPSISLHGPPDDSNDPKEYAIPLVIPNSSKRPSFLEYNHAYNLPVPSSSPVNTTGYNKLMRLDSAGTVPIDNLDTTEIHPDFLHHSHLPSSAQSSQPLPSSYSRLVLPTDYLIPVKNPSSVIMHDYEEILPKETIPVEQNLAYSTSCHQ